MPDHSEAMVRIAADGILVVHAAWALFLLAGFLVVRGHCWAERVHLGGLVLNVLLDLTGTPFPLTVMETALRLRCDDPASAYHGSCISHYLGSILPQVPWTSVQIWGGALLLGIALWRDGVPHWLRIAALRRAH